MNKTKVLYRYVYFNTDFGVKVELLEFPIIKKTNKGVWIGHELGNNTPGKFKFILDKSRKKYASTTKEEALENLELRIEKRLEILNSQRLTTIQAKTLIENGKI